MESDGLSANPKTMIPGIDPALGRISVRLASGHWAPMGDAATPLPEGGALRLDGGPGLALRTDPLPSELAGRLATLDLRGLPVTAGLLEGLGALPALETLVLAESSADDEALRALALFPSLRALDISGTRISDAGVASLSGLPLRSLVLNRTALTNVAAGALASMTSMQVLRLGETRMDDEGVRELCALRTLRDIELPPRASDDAIVAVAHLPSLTALWLAGTSITDHAFDSLPEVGSLRVIALPDQLGDVSLRALTRFPGLETLWHESGEFSGEGISALSNLKRLSSCFFSGPLTGEAATALARLESLRRLCLFSPATTRYIIEMLSVSAAIEELRFSSRTFRDEDAWLLTRFVALRRLHVAESALSARGYRELRRSLSRCVVTHAPRGVRIPERVYQGELLMRRNSPEGSAPWHAVDGSARVVNVPADHELSYRASDCEKLEELEGFVEAVGGLIVELKLTHCTLGRDAGPVLAKLTRLACLETPKSILSPEALSAIAGLPALQKLVLDLTTLGDADVGLLVGSASLSELHLRATLLTNEGLAVIGGLAPLKVLRIEGAPVTAAGLEAFRKLRPDVQVFV